LLGIIYLIFAQDKNTELLLDSSINVFFTLVLPATVPIYLMVLMFDIIMVVVRFSSSAINYEISFFKKVMIFEIIFVVIIIFSWAPYFFSVFT